MVSKPFSFRLPDAGVQALEALQIEGETLNQTAQRFLMESLGLSTDTPLKLSTPVDIQVLVRQEVENAIANSERLQELQQIITKVDKRLGELSVWERTLHLLGSHQLVRLQL